MEGNPLFSQVVFRAAVRGHRVVGMSRRDESFVSTNVYPVFNTSSTGAEGRKVGHIVPKNGNNWFVPVFHVQSKTFLALE